MPRYCLLKPFLLLSLSLLLTACGFFDKDNTPTPTPLKEFKSEMQPRLLFRANTAASIGSDYKRMTMAINESSIFTVGAQGVVNSVDRTTGKRNWRVFTSYALSSGPGVGEELVVVGGLHGEVVALRETDGKRLWTTTVPGAILAQPALVHGTIVIKAIDGYLRGLSIADGHELWSFQQVEPSLLLRGASAPLIHQRSVIAGFANGNLAKVDSDTGQVVWLRQIAEPEGAFAIQRMVDIDADPIMFDYHLYAATYQGNIASLDWISGKILWSHELSSYTGMSASENSIYISDANGFIWSFNAKNGLINWRQMELAYRGVTGPAIIGNYVVVGDKQGYLHWLDKNDGHYAGRIKVGSGPIFSAPIVKNNVLYAINNQGSLSAYTLD